MTYEVWVEVAGQAMDPRRVLDHPVEEIRQGEDVAADMPIGTDGRRADAGMEVQARQCHKHEENLWKK